MKAKNIVFAALLLSSLGLVAQTKGEVKKMPMAENPVDSSTSLLSYRMAIETSLPDSIIYKRVAHWYKTINKSMRVSNDECVANKKMVGKGETDLLGIKDGGQQPKAGRLKYTVTTTIDNSKVTVEITRFNMQNTIYTPIEPWLKLQTEDIKYKYYFIFIEEYSKTMLDKFNEVVNVKMMK